jgi:hypothetical protein
MKLFKRSVANQIDKLQVVADALSKGTELVAALDLVKVTSKEYLALWAAQDPRKWEADKAAAKDFLQTRGMSKRQEIV